MIRGFFLKRGGMVFLWEPSGAPAQAPWPRGTRIRISATRLGAVLLIRLATLDVSQHQQYWR